MFELLIAYKWPLFLSLALVILLREARKNKGK